MKTTAVKGAKEPQVSSAEIMVRGSSSWETGFQGISGAGQLIELWAEE